MPPHKMPHPNDYVTIAHGARALGIWTCRLRQILAWNSILPHKMFRGAPKYQWRALRENFLNFMALEEPRETAARWGIALTTVEEALAYKKIVRKSNFMKWRLSPALCDLILKEYLACVQNKTTGPNPSSHNPVSPPLSQLRASEFLIHLTNRRAA